MNHSDRVKESDRVGILHVYKTDLHLDELLALPPSARKDSRYLELAGQFDEMSSDEMQAIFQFVALQFLTRLHKAAGPSAVSVVLTTYFAQHPELVNEAIGRLSEDGLVVETIDADIQELN